MVCIWVTCTKNSCTYRPFYNEEFPLSRTTMFQPLLDGQFQQSMFVLHHVSEQGVAGACRPRRQPFHTPCLPPDRPADQRCHECPPQHTLEPHPQFLKACNINKHHRSIAYTRTTSSVPEGLQHQQTSQVNSIHLNHILSS